MARRHSFPDFPGVSTKTNNGKLRYRFRHKLVKDHTFAAEFGTQEFLEEYERLVNKVVSMAGTPPKAKSKIKLAKHIGDRTFGHAWMEYRASFAWKNDFKEITRNEYTRQIENFLDERIDPDAELIWRTALVNEVAAEYVQRYYERIFLTNPTKAKYRMVIMNKLYATAIDLKWIPLEGDKTRFLRKHAAPQTEANPPWPDEYRQRFEAHFKLGTPARTAYEIAFALGARRCDIHRLSTDHIELREERAPDGTLLRRFEAIRWTAHKHRKNKKPANLYHEISDRLERALAHVPRVPGRVLLLNSRGEPYTAVGLGSMMKYWCDQVQIPDGYRLHAIRHSFATDLCLDGADLLDVQKAMGHAKIDQTLHYMRRAENELAMQRVAKLKNGEGQRPTLKTVARLKVVK